METFSLEFWKIGFLVPGSNLTLHVPLCVSQAKPRKEYSYSPSS